MTEHVRSIQDIADRTAEWIVVAGIVTDDTGEEFQIWRDHCHIDDLTDPHVAHIMRIYLSVYEARGAACHLDVLTALNNDPKHGAELVPLFLSMCSRWGGGTPAYAETYAKRIGDLGRHRRALRQIELLLGKATNAKTSTERLLMLEEAKRVQVPNDDDSKAETKNAQLSRIYNQIREGRGREPAIRSPMATLTEILAGGWRAGRLYVWAGPPSFGKTSFAIGEMLEACAQGHRAAFVSLEMTSESLNSRILSYLSRVPMLRMAAPSVDDLIDLQRAAAAASDFDYVIMDMPGRRVSNIVEALSREHEAKPLGFVVVDYLQRIVPSDAKAPQHQEIGRNSKALANLARLLKVPMILLSQCNRAYGSRGSRRFQMTDLAGSGEIEADADLVGFIWRPGKNTHGFAPDYAEIDIKKFREGPQDYRQIRFDGATYRFEDAVCDVPAAEDGTPKNGGW